MGSFWARTSLITWANASEVQAMQAFTFKHFESGLHLFEKMAGTFADCMLIQFATSFPGFSFSVPGMGTRHPGLKVVPFRNAIIDIYLLLAFKPIQVEIKTESRDAKSSSESDSESEKENDSESQSQSEEERVPRVDTDDVYKLTEEEKQWERAGHFQPKKLNIALMSGFQQAPANVEEKPAPKRTQTTFVPAKLIVKEPEKEELEIEDIR